MAAYSLSKQAELGLTDVETAYAFFAPWAAGVGTTIASIDVFLLIKFHDSQTPTGFPRATIADHVYQGMFIRIPKGATVYANIYAMTTDLEIFPDADEFKPERFYI
ncbi:cytochrome P450 [Mycena epipterygia]|nr:cytochrome P450 [Mycena epipterygia]